MVFTSHLLFIGRPSAHICAAQLWLELIGFCIIISTFICKEFRVQMALVRHTKYIYYLNDGYLTIALIALISIEVILLAVWNNFAGPKVSMIYLYDSMDFNSFVCQLSPVTTSQIASVAALYVYNIFLIIICGTISVMNLNISSRFSEAAFILANMFDTAFTAALRIPVRQASEYDTSNDYNWNIVS
jgi:hypothetical protein